VCNAICREWLCSAEVERKICLYLDTRLYAFLEAESWCRAREREAREAMIPLKYDTQMNVERLSPHFCILRMLPGLSVEAAILLCLSSKLRTRAGTLEAACL